MNVRIDLPFGDGKTTPVQMRELEATKDGKRRWAARGRIPMTGCFDIREVTPVTRDGHMDDEDERDGHMDDEDRGSEDKMMRGAHGEMVLEGIASSSSTDWHGTSMSLDALRMMAEQFKTGVPYVATHHDAEWMHMLGQTFGAEVVQSGAIKAAHGDDAGYVLKVQTTLFPEDKRSAVLMSLLKRGVSVGWSIGGWFTDLEVITNEQDEVEAMVVRGVELDHLATTRTPSNPNSFVTAFSQDTSDALRAIRTRETTPSRRDGMETRHVWKVVETEDTVHVVFGKSEGNWMGVHTEDMEEMSKDEMEEMTSSDMDERMPEDMEEKASDKDMEEMASKDDMEEMKADDMEEMGADKMDERIASEFSDLPLTSKDMPWDWNAGAANEILMSGDGTEDEPNWEMFKKAHFWYDADNAETREAYKLPFAKLIDGELKAVPRGVIAALAALNGARGGVDIPDADRQDVYDAIVRYYAKWGDDEPPALRAEPMIPNERSIMNYRGLPVAEMGTTWSWGVGDAEAVLGVEMDWQRYQMAHLAYNEYRLHDIEGYEYPFAMMIDGELKAVVTRVQSLLAMINEGTLELGEPERAKAYEHLVRYVVEAGMEPEPYRSPVDSRSRLCSTADKGVDAQRSASSAEYLNPNAGGAAMADETVESNVAATDATSDRLDKIESLFLRAVEAMSNPVVESAPAVVDPTPVETVDEVSVLRSRLAEMEKRMINLAQQPVRRGRPHTARVESHAPASAFEGVVRSAESALPAGSALVTVCREQAQRRAAGPMELPSRAQLHADLRAVLAAALADGVITDPDHRAAWR